MAPKRNDICARVRRMLFFSLYLCEIFGRVMANRLLQTGEEPLLYVVKLTEEHE